MYSLIKQDENETRQRRPSCLECVTSVLAIEVLKTLEKDAIMLMISKALRMFSFGFLAVMLVIYLDQLGFSANVIGLMFTSTLLGDAVISIILTSFADRWGRKRSLITGAILAIITSFVFSCQRNYWVLLISAILGVISPSGSEVGPFLSIEISSISQLVREADRTKLMAWYNLVGSFASASGALLCGIVMDIMIHKFSFSTLAACRWIMIIYSTLQVFQAFLYAGLSNQIEVELETVKIRTPVDSFLGLHKSKWIVLQLSLLFMIDSFAGSFIMQSLISAWFYSTYHTSSTLLGTMVFVCNLCAGISALFAAKLADYIGLILTMVVTHLPSNVLVILVPLMPTETLAIVMLCARYCISQMDVPTRNAYVQGVVDANERSAASGVTNVVRMLGASLGPYFAGMLYASAACSDVPFYIAGGLKIVYDLLLLYSFQSVKTTHEQQTLGGGKKRGEKSENGAMDDKTAVLPHGVEVEGDEESEVELKKLSSSKQ